MSTLKRYNGTAWEKLSGVGVLTTATTSADGLMSSADKTTLNTINTTVNQITSNKVTSISSSSTDDQYPSAKCVYDLIGDIESMLEELL